jgi:hypothetical protein
MITYLYPNGSKAPTQAQMEHKYSSVHARVDFPADPNPAPAEPVTLDVVHNFQFDMEAPPEGLQLPIVVCNAISGGPGAPAATISQNPDGNSVKVGKLGPGPVSYDVWIFRHPVKTSFLGL